MIGKKWIFAFLMLASCGEPEQVHKKRFQDIKGYFNQEALRLEKQNASVSKTVYRNGISESRKNISPDWNTELNLFAESDINKPAWRDNYKVSSNGKTISYTALDNKLRTQSVVIKKNEKGVLTELTMLNRTSNYLYNSSEELQYIPDSLYRIIKKQDVILLGKNDYQIIGTFN